MANKKYNNKEADAKAFELACIGKSDEEIAEILGITIRTFYRWKKQRSSFKKSLSDGRLAVSQAVKSLHELTQGKEVEDIITKIVIDQETGEEKVVAIDRKTKTIMPNNNAIQYFLNNRDPNNWNMQVDDVGEGKIEAFIEIAKGISQEGVNVVCDESYNSYKTQIEGIRAMLEAQGIPITEDIEKNLIVKDRYSYFGGGTSDYKGCVIDGQKVASTRADGIPIGEDGKPIQ